MVVATKATGTFTRGEEEIVKLVARGQLLVQAALKALSMFGAPASLELIDDNPHAASIVDK
jgi:hypothetical protein